MFPPLPRVSCAPDSPFLANATQAMDQLHTAHVRISISFYQTKKVTTYMLFIMEEKRRDFTDTIGKHNN